MNNNLISCLACGKKISKNAISCPECGEPNKKSDIKKHKTYIILWLIFGIFGFHLAYAGYKKWYYAHLVAICAGFIIPFLYHITTNRYMPIQIFTFYFLIIGVITASEIIITKDSNGISFQ